MRPGWVGVLIGYLTLLAALGFGYRIARERWLESMQAQSAQAEWDAWRDKSRQEEKQPGPVSRRAARSAEPPTLVLLRDYSTACLFGLALFATVIYGVGVLGVHAVIGKRA